MFTITQLQLGIITLNTRFDPHFGLCVFPAKVGIKICICMYLTVMLTIQQPMFASNFSLVYFLCIAVSLSTVVLNSRDR